MKLEITQEELIAHVNRQLSNLFGPGLDVTLYIEAALSRCEMCFKVNKSSYYHDKDNEVFFSPYHSGQYSIFLYFLSNTIYKEKNNKKLATVVYYLNKVLHSVDWYYEIELPEYWGVEHPLGCVLGRAVYSNGLFLYQGCTIGGNKGKYPLIGENVILYANSSILGDSKIGNRVLVSAGTLIKDDTIPDDCIVFGQSPNLNIKKKDKNYIDGMISHFWTI